MHPQLVSVTATGVRNEYVVVLLDSNGHNVVTRATVQDAHGIQVVGYDPDVVTAPGTWAGDAESVRSVVRAIVAVHNARWCGREDQ